MITMDQIPTDVLVDSLYSEVCPACGDAKKEQQTFCWNCYRSLPQPMKSALYNLVGKGYEPAVLEAMNFLNAEKVHT